MRTLRRVSIDQFFFLFFLLLPQSAWDYSCLPRRSEKKKGSSVELQQLELVVNKPFGV